MSKVERTFFLSMAYIKNFVQEQLKSYREL